MEREISFAVVHSTAERYAVVVVATAMGIVLVETFEDSFKHAFQTRVFRQCAFEYGN